MTKKKKESPKEKRDEEIVLRPGAYLFSSLNPDSPLIISRINTGYEALRSKAQKSLSERE